MSNNLENQKPDKDGHEIELHLSEDVIEDLTERGKLRGRTLEEQIRYELEVNHGLRPPDPGDTEQAEFARLHQRMTKGQPLQG